MGNPPFYISFVLHRGHDSGSDGHTDIPDRQPWRSDGHADMHDRYVPSYLIGADIMKPGDRPRLGTALVLGPFLWPLVTCLCLVPKQSSPVGSGRHKYLAKKLYILDRKVLD